MQYLANIFGLGMRCVNSNLVFLKPLLYMHFILLHFKFFLAHSFGISFQIILASLKSISAVGFSHNNNITNSSVLQCLKLSWQTSLQTSNNFNSAGSKVLFSCCILWISTILIGFVFERWIRCLINIQLHFTITVWRNDAKWLRMWCSTCTIHCFYWKKENSCEYSHCKNIVFKCFHNLIGFFATYHNNFSWIINLSLDLLVCSITDCIIIFTHLLCFDLPTIQCKS